ncbi:ATP-binding cassette domain-containing protein [Nocardioides sp. Y6]|uniref:ATP-binding cassette domain-containing protein n=1 Tax=Nocardioides malaquae TaxID=2773426 RepID=A0ABR9RW01_9ACTN|nr:ATP-binding cassette domain-containing protein [Nocardioides malaquae]MBE7325737.1 ATP-binding cassette domain-containing protein [Nocardioides malaquae]
MSLQISLVVPERRLDVTVDVPRGSTLAVLGPNGAGKSTILHAVAGLLRPHDARIALGGRVLSEVVDGHARTWVPAHRRRVSLLAQQADLFPHLTVRDNVAFGPRSRGSGRTQAGEIAEEWLDRVGLEALGQRRPSQLSGGQAQRVAVARALAAAPDLVLLDEPFAALDVDATPALRHVLGEVLAERTAVIVTHDVLDAVLLADAVAVVEEGRVVEHGPTHEVLSRPRSRFGARIAGLNLVAGTWDGSGVRTRDGRRLQGTLREAGVGDGAPVVALFRPAAVAVHLDTVPGSPRNVVEVTVSTLEPHGDLVRVRGDDLHADITPAAVAELRLAPGMRAQFVVKAAEVEIHPATT